MASRAAAAKASSPSAAAVVYKIPRSFKLRLELEYAEKGPESKGGADAKEAKTRSPHEAWCSYGLGDITVGFDKPSTYETQLQNWNGTIIGPQSTNMGDKIYSLKIRCGPLYPDEPPIVYFLNKVNMPGVNKTTGKVEGIMTAWTRHNTLMDYLIAIRTAMEGAASGAQPGQTEMYPAPPI